MTWLFTQVWLWSLAAFVLGSLLNWMLFVLPLRRRFRALADEYANYAADVAERFDGKQSNEPQPEPSGMDLLPTEVDAQREADAQFEPTFGDWHRPPRAWMPSSGGAEATDTVRLQQGSSVTGSPSATGAEQSSEPQATSASLAGRQPQQRSEPPQPQGNVRGRGAADDQAPETLGGRETPGIPADETELRMEEQREVSERRANFRAERPVAPRPPTAPAEPGHVPPEPAGPAAPVQAEPESREAQSSWFQKGTMDDPEESFAWATAFDPPQPQPQPQPAPEPGGTEPRSKSAGVDAEDTGQLRSLFQPRSTPASRSAAASEQDAPGEQAVPPGEAPVTEAASTPPVAGESGGEAPAKERPGEDGVLPRRTPGHGPRPGRQNLNRLRKEAAADGEARSEHGQVASAPGDVGVPAGADSPETARAEEQARREGKMVKGHFASRQYHTPESPQYDRVVAEVWFRSAADAEQAGFEPWDGHRSSN